MHLHRLRKRCGWFQPSRSAHNCSCGLPAKMDACQGALHVRLGTEARAPPTASLLAMCQQAWSARLQFSSSSIALMAAAACVSQACA